jgi:acyl-coenzyme A thioesterase PaaI-like protein
VEIPPHHDPSCWGCGQNPSGIALPTPGGEGLSSYEATFAFREEHQAGPGLVHGGLVAAALDEAGGLLATWYRFPSVTTRFAVRYRQPVHINRKLTIRAELEQDSGRRLEIRCELLDGNDLLADAQCTWTHVPLEHFLRTPEGRAAGEAWRERLGS